MKMRYGLTRQAYETLFNPIDWPLSTQQAVTVLRSMGYAATVPAINYALRKGEIPHPKGEGRNLQWQAEHLDAAADFLEANETYTPGTTARMVLNINPAQDIQALRDAQKRWPEVYEFAMTVVPGRPGLNEYATVRYVKG